MSVLITGASGGIGKATAILFARAGFATAICYNTNGEAAKALCEELTAEGCVCKTYGGNLSDPHTAGKLVEAVAQDLGPVTVLVNNAGISYSGLLTDMSDTDYKEVMAVNLDSAFYLSRAVLPSMVHEKNGSIINVSSMWGEVGASCEVVYSTAKAGLIGFTKALAKEVGPSNIRVNCVSPGVIDTPMNACYDEETMRDLAEETPLNRIGTPEEVANVIFFLASDKATFITGQDIGVNGGMI